MELFWEVNTLGMAVLMATHDLELVRKHSKARVLELDHGKLVYDSVKTEAASSEVRRMLLSRSPSSGVGRVCERRPESQTHQHVLRRASEPHYEDEHEAVCSAVQRI